MSNANNYYTIHTTLTTKHNLLLKYKCNSPSRLRDKFLGHTLLDATAAAMILPSLENRMRCRDDNVPSNAFIDSSEDVVVSEIVVDGVDTAVEPTSKKQKTLEHLQPHGSSLGPYWFDKFRAESKTKGSPFTNARCACHSCRPGFFCMPNGGVEEELEEKVDEGGESPVASAATSEASRNGRVVRDVRNGEEFGSSNVTFGSI